MVSKGSQDSDCVTGSSVGALSRAVTLPPADTGFCRTEVMNLAKGELLIELQFRENERALGCERETTLYLK